jgi:hypothetical protein
MFGQLKIRLRRVRGESAPLNERLACAIRIYAQLFTDSDLPQLARLQAPTSKSA